MSSNISFVINEGTNSITGLFVSDIGDARSNEREFVTTFSAFNIDYISRFLNILVLHGRDSISDQVKAWPTGEVANKRYLSPKFTEEIFYSKNFFEVKEKILEFVKILEEKFNHKPDIVFDGNIVKICFSNIDCISILLHRDPWNDSDELPYYMFNGKLYEYGAKIEIRPYLDLVVLPSIIDDDKSEEKLISEVLQMFREVFYKESDVNDSEIVTPLFHFYNEFSSKIKVITIGDIISRTLSFTSTDIVSIIYRLYYALFYINSFYGKLKMEYVPYIGSIYDSYKIGDIDDFKLLLSIYKGNTLMIVVDTIFNNGKHLVFVFTDSVAPLVVIERDSRRFAKRVLNVQFDSSISGDIAFNILFNLTIPIAVYRYKDNLSIVSRRIGKEIEKYIGKNNEIIVDGFFDNVSVYRKNRDGFEHLVTFWNGKQFSSY